MSAGRSRRPGAAEWLYHHLDDPDTNAARCASCGTWTTDHYKPDQVAGIISGSVLRGVFLCEPCRVAVIYGEMPADRLRGLPFEGPLADAESGNAADSKA